MMNDRIHFSHSVLYIIRCRLAVPTIRTIVWRSGYDQRDFPKTEDETVGLLTYLAKFLAPTIAAVPTAYAPSVFAQLEAPIWLCPTASATRS